LLRCKKQIPGALPGPFATAKKVKELVLSREKEGQGAGYYASSQVRDGLTGQRVTEVCEISKFKQKAIKLDTQDHGHKCKSDSGFGENSCTSLDPLVLQSKWKLARTWCFDVESARIFQLDCCQSLVLGEELLTEAEGLACSEGLENFTEGILSFMPVTLHRGEGIFFVLEKTAFS